MSGRVESGAPNPIAVKRSELRAAGVDLTDLTDTNPTRHGLFNPQILEILAEATTRAGRYDPAPRGPWPARAALAERFGGDPDDYWLTASTSEAYGWLFTILAEPGDSVAAPSPGYPLIEPLARLHDLTTSFYPTYYLHPSGWELDRDRLGALPARMVVAVNPNNPTGAYADPWLRDHCAARGVPLIADEVFFPFRLDPPAPPAPTCPDSRKDETSAGTKRAPACPPGPLPQDAASSAAEIPLPPRRLAGDDTVLTFGLDGLSKLLAAPQLKLGWIRLSGPRGQRQSAADALDQVADTYLSVNSPVALALPALLELADASVRSVTHRLADNLATARHLFADLRIRTVRGGWMMLLDVPPVKTADDLCVALMERAGLYVHPGYFYDLPGSTLAISLLPRPDTFREACTRLTAALTVFAAER